MIRRLTLLLTLCLLSLTSLLAKTWSPETLPVAQNSPTPTYVSNPDGILSQRAVTEIDTLLLRIEKSKGVKALIVAITNIEGDDPYRFATDLGLKYGVGTKDNTGLVIVLATDDRSYWISTGTGLEKFLPDAICKRIENRVMVPLLKQARWEEALVETVRAITQQLEGEGELQGYQGEEEDLPWVLLLLPIGLICLCVAGAIYVEYKRKKCPNCNQHKLKLIRRTTKNISARKMLITEIWVCSNCGHQLTRTRKADRTDIYNNGGGGGGGIFVAPGGGGFSGGFNSGPSFGSFGGGSFSGGGAGGRF